jgi:hypothetical protein
MRLEPVVYLKGIDADPAETKLPETHLSRKAAESVPMPAPGSRRRHSGDGWNQKEKP